MTQLVTNGLYCFHICHSWLPMVSTMVVLVSYKTQLVTNCYNNGSMYISPSNDCINAIQCGQIKIAIFQYCLTVLHFT